MTKVSTQSIAESLNGSKYRLPATVTTNDPTKSMLTKRIDSSTVPNTPIDMMQLAKFSWITKVTFTFTLSRPCLKTAKNNCFYSR